jgi:hypothetical protein
LHGFILWAVIVVVGPAVLLGGQSGGRLRQWSAASNLDPPKSFIQKYICENNTRFDDWCHPDPLLVLLAAESRDFSFCDKA